MTINRQSRKKRSEKTLFYRGAVVAIAVVAGKYLFPSAPQAPCTEDEAIDTVVGTVQPCSCFSETYLEARDKFREAAQGAKATLYQLEIYQNYTTDVAFLPGTTDGLVVHTSGVHGIEGYAGSAVQVAMLNSLPASRPSILLFHAVNPYGMAHYRRFNENNVDINRNGIHDFTKILKRDPNLAYYEDFDSQFNPTAPFRYGFFGELLPKLLQHGLSKLKKAMVTGQYHKQEGIFYGGTQLEASNVKLYEFTKEFLENNPPSGKTTWINLHTGLGKFGMDTILLVPGGHLHAGKAAQVFNESLVPGASGGDDVQDGYDLTRGTTEEFMKPLLPDAWILTQEFGTIHSILVGRALILENMMTQQGLDSGDLLKSAFYQRTPEWRRSILRRGLRVLQQAMDR